MRQCEAARMLAAEAHEGKSARRIALHLFFETADFALRDMEREERDIANGTAVFSVHQPTTEQIIRVVDAHCNRLVAMLQVKRVVLRAADCGFFAAFLAVLDTILLAPPELEIEIDWRLTGGEKHFTYKPPHPGDCVWRCLFEPVEINKAGTRRPAAKNESLELDCRFNFAFTARFRSYFTLSPHYELMRTMYNEVFRKHVVPKHPDLVSVLEGLGAELSSCECIGVHKRVDTLGTMEYQTCRKVYSCDDFIKAVRAMIKRRPKPVELIFLATDDENAEETFRQAFGSMLRVRQNVQRVPGGLNSDGTLNEVHIASPFNPGCTVRDAVDVVADAMLLAKCNCVLHMDSNVTSAVSLMSAEVEMVHIRDEARRGGAFQ